MLKQQENYPLSPPKLFTTKLCTLNLKYQFYGGISFEYILHLLYNYISHYKRFYKYKITLISLFKIRSKY